jgi:hypothetical protein
MPRQSAIGRHRHHYEPTLPPGHELIFNWGSCKALSEDQLPNTTRPTPLPDKPTPRTTSRAEANPKRHAPRRNATRRAARHAPGI